MDEFETAQGSWARSALPRRWLVICLDGVPFEESRRLWDEGHFREFARPAAVVSTFPSDSEAAMTAALHAPPVPGYEHRYFDRTQNQIRGGVWATLSGESSPYIRRLDYDEPGIFKGLHYIVRRKSFRADLGRLVGRFRRSNAPLFVAHLASSDAMYHVLAPAEVRALLTEVESAVGELYLDSRGELGVVLFSDHGNTRTPSRPAPLETALRQRGWRWSDRLAGPRDVAVPAYGLIGFAALYCREESVAQLARDAASVEGVELAIYRDGSRAAVWVLGAGGSRAQVRWSADGQRFWYDTASGDPLELLPVFAELRLRGRLAQDGSALDADLLAATLAARYPDAPARLRDWATDHVLNRASVAVSLKPGYFYGRGLFAHIVTLRSTHGALESRSSLGFAMATHPLPATARLGNLLPSHLRH